MSFRGALLVLFLGAFVANGCDDVSPLRYEAPKRDADVPDHVDLGHVAACRQCATAPGAPCRAGYDSCQAADSRCGGLLDCLTDTDCWRQLNLQNFGDPPPCAVDCLGRAHVAGINEIGVPATAFYVCVADAARCGPVCFDQPLTPGRDR